MKSKYVIIISLLFLFTFCFYVESNAKDKHEDIIKLKEVYLKVVDKKYIGTSNIGYTSFSFTKNSLVINTGREYAILPLKNIKELDKTKSSYDIFKPGANSNVSSIIPCDNCMWACEKKSVNSGNLSFLWYTKKIWKELKYGTKKETSTQSSNDGG